MNENDEGSPELNNYEAISVSFTSGKREVSVGGRAGEWGVGAGSVTGFLGPSGWVHDDHGSIRIGSSGRPGLALSRFSIGVHHGGAAQSTFLGPTPTTSEYDWTDVCVW